MIDFHNHILPSVDDGSKSIDMSLSMLQHAQNQGITDVVNTVHLQHPKMDGKNVSFNTINKEIDTLKNILNKNNIDINIHIGSEVFFLPNLVELIDNPLATIGNGKYMLIEFQVHQLPYIHKQELFDLKMAGVTPIIAHPERYNDVMEDISIVTNWLESGCIIQVDAGSVLGYLGSGAQKTSERIIKNGWCHILGSDSHNDRGRNFCLKEAVELVRNWIGDEVEFLVNNNPEAVIKGKMIDIDFEYEPRKQSNFFSRIIDRIGLT